MVLLQCDGLLPISMVFLQYQWSSTCLWSCSSVHGLPPVSMVFPQYPWSSTCLWSSTSVHGLPPVSIVSIQCPWSSASIHGPPPCSASCQLPGYVDLDVMIAVGIVEQRIPFIHRRRRFTSSNQLNLYLRTR